MLCPFTICDKSGNLCLRSDGSVMTQTVRSLPLQPFWLIPVRPIRQYARQKGYGRGQAEVLLAVAGE